MAGVCGASRGVGWLEGQAIACSTAGRIPLKAPERANDNDPSRRPVTGAGSGSPEGCRYGAQRRTDSTQDDPHAPDTAGIP
jgi:hypothetical protein